MKKRLSAKVVSAWFVVGDKFGFFLLSSADSWDHKMRKTLVSGWVFDYFMTFLPQYEKFSLETWKLFSQFAVNSYFAMLWTLNSCRYLDSMLNKTLNSRYSPLFYNSQNHWFKITRWPFSREKSFFIVPSGFWCLLKSLLCLTLISTLRCEKRISVLSKKFISFPVSHNSQAIQRKKVQVDPSTVFNNQLRLFIIKAKRAPVQLPVDSALNSRDRKFPALHQPPVPTKNAWMMRCHYCLLS